MKKQSWMVCAGLILALGLVWSNRCYGDAAADFQQGKALLEQGNFTAALKAYDKAAQASPDNGQYTRAVAQLRQAVQTREQLASETNDEQWERLAQSLHTYYAKQRLYDALQAVDEQIHRRLDTAASAVQLAETLLARGQAAEAVKVLEGVKTSQVDTSTQALKALALAQTGETEKARTVAGEIWVDGQTGPGDLYRVARLQAALGNKQAAISNLVRCFETASADALPGFKSHAKHAGEFEAIASSDEFAKALQTQPQVKSQVRQASCSSGNCPTGNCPDGNCPIYYSY